jgi:cytochrome c-type biogenesis protein CcmH/NrfG
MKNAARAWPAQFPSDAFAERVVRAALAERSSRVVEATELFADDESIDREVRRSRVGRRRFTRSALAMVALLVLSMGIGAAYVGNRQREMAQRPAVAAAAVANSPTTVVPAAARLKAASSANARSKMACRCPPGDSLCSCL